MRGLYGAENRRDILEGAGLSLVVEDMNELRVDLFVLFAEV